MMYFIIGLRNIRKNLRRNALTMAMISFGMVALVVYNGSNTQMFRLFRSSVIHDQYGHYQLYAKGFIENGRKSPYDYLITDYSRIEKELLSDPDVDFVAPRLSFAGVATSDERSAIVKGFGGMPGPESRMEYGRVGKGSFFNDTAIPSAIVGDYALRKMSSQIGKTLTVLVTMKGGGIAATDFKVTGVKNGFGESDVMNQMFILADLPDVQSLIGVSDSVDTVIVHLKDDRSMRKKEQAIAELCARNGLEYRKWDDLAVFYGRARDVFLMNERVLTVIILIISVFIVINTLYMAYMSRIREIGTMRAIGTTKAQVLRIVISESVILSVLGCMLGLLIAVGISFLINSAGGIYHPESVFNERPFYTKITPELSSVIAYFGMFVLVSVLASIVISFRSLRLSIADSLRWN